MKPSSTNTPRMNAQHPKPSGANTPSTKTSSGVMLTDVRRRRVHLVGRPNVGKSTLFNLLTGARQATMNVPRTTVSVERGVWQLASGEKVEVTDLPGTYSLIPQSPDEEVTARAVAELSRTQNPGDVAIVVLDATALSSSLYLLAQTAMSGLNVIGALSMADLSAANGTQLSAQRLEQVVGIPVVNINPRKGQGGADLGAALAEREHLDTPRAGRQLVEDASPYASLPVPQPSNGAKDLASLDPDSAFDLAHEIFGWVEAVVDELGIATEPSATVSDKIDGALFRPVVGVPVFLAILWATFQLTTSVSGPIQDWFESLITGPVTQAFSGMLAAVHAPAWLDSLVVNGVLAGVGTVVSFLPLMIIIFTMIFVLEDSGYLARVAVMADRGMQAIGLDGRAVLPLVIGFGCNIPALSATKTIPDARQRLLTGLLIPYSSCTARLVIYLFLASVFFPDHAGTVVFGMYLMSALVILGIAWTLRRTAFRGAVREPLLIVLPAYQAPRLGALLRAVAIRCKGFVSRAGIVILGLSMAVWVLMAVPIDSEHSFGDVDMPVTSSLFGGAASSIAPVFSPAGFDDWHVTASLITGFVAKEAVVGTLATTYGLEEPEGDQGSSDLNARVALSLEVSSDGHGALATVSFMVFCLVYTPCLVTVAEQKRLFGAKITAASVLGSVVLAWVLATVIFQVGRLFL